MTLQLNNVVVEYGKSFRAIDGISITLEQGLTGLIGPNGAGKTTLMKTLATLIAPASGQILLNGREITGKNREVLREQIGYLPQAPGFHKNLTVFETLDYYGMLQELEKRVRARRIEELLSITHLEEHRNKKVRQLSGGMKRRLGLAQAMIHNPKILIVDEPTVGLDPEERIHIRMLLSIMASDRIVLLSTHVVEDIASTCSKVIILENGHAAFEGMTTEIVRRAEGHVYIRTVSDEMEAARLQGERTVTGIIYDIDWIHVRYVSREPSKTDKPVKPSLEDAYVYARQCYREGGLS